MENSVQESLDGSSIKPVSSLRSHFEQMANLKPNFGGAPYPRVPSPKLPTNGTIGRFGNVPLPSSNRPDKMRVEGLPAARGRGREQGKSLQPTCCTSTRNLSLSPKATFQIRRSSNPPPQVKVLPPRSPPSSKMMRLTMPVTQAYSSMTSPTTVSGSSSPKNFRIPARSHSPAQESRKSGRKSSSQPPSPPPPRRSSELRRPPPPPPMVSRAEKPKINSKPISLTLRPETTASGPGQSQLMDDEVSPFCNPSSSDNTVDEFHIPGPLPDRRLRFSESCASSYKSYEPSLLSPHVTSRGEGDGRSRSVRDNFLPQNTAGKTPNSRGRPVVLEPIKIRSTQVPPNHPAPVAGANSETMPLSPLTIPNTRIFSTPSLKNARPLLPGHQKAANPAPDRACSELIPKAPLRSLGQSSNDTPTSMDSTTPTLEPFPDSSHSNRRPPYMRKGARQIPTKYETRIMDVCGEFICTSGYYTKVWSLSDGEVVANIAHTEGVKITSVAFKPASDIQNEGSQLWLGSNIGDILEFDILSQNLSSTRSNAHARREIVKIYRHNYDMWTFDDGGTLNLWLADSNGGLELGTPAHSFLLPRGHTFSMVVGDELWFATGKNIRVYMPTADTSIQFEVLKRPLRQQNIGDVTSGTTIGTQPGRLYFGHADGKISIYSKQDYACLSVVDISMYKISAMAGIAGKIWTGFSSGMIYVYDVGKSPWAVKKDWSAHQGPIIKLFSDASSCWSLNRAQVVTLGQDNSLRIWDGFLEDDWIETQMHSQEAKFCEFKSINALVMTWNAGASTPFALQQRDQDAAFFRDLIHSSGCPDIIVFGFQELVDLENKKTVTKSFFKSKKKDPSVQEHMSHQYRNWRDFLTRCLDDFMPSSELYHLLHTASLVGLFTCIFVRSQLRERIRNLNAAEVKRGLGGLHGNKGALIIRFLVDDTSICLVNCHLAAGQTGTKDRNADITAILETPILPAEKDHSVRQDSYIGGGDGTMILDHEICILNGDLNYRIDTMSRDTVINAVKANNISKLLERDQLLASKRKNPLFKLRAFHELPINFSPTYKYDVGTDTYDTSEKKRSPAWCDRILFRGTKRIEQLDYRRHEVRVSDHRPVTGSFQIIVKRILPKERAIQWEDVQQQYLRRKEKFANQAM